MRKTKVVLIQGLLAPYRYPIFEKMSSRGDWDFEVWFMGFSVKNRIWTKDEISKYKFRYKFLKGLTFNVGLKDNYPFWFNPIVVWEIYKSKPDVIIMFGWDSLTSFIAHIACSILGIKFIIYSDSTDLEKSWRRTLTLPLVKRHIRAADGLIAGGSRAYEYLLLLGAKPKDIKISYNSVDVDRYCSLTNKYKKEKHKLKSDLGINGRVLMFYGQLITRKGVDILLQAFEQVLPIFPDLNLLVVGDGKEKENLKKFAKRHNLNNVFFIDNPGDYMVCKYYAISDVFVLPSREEVWGLVANEAMAAGLPVIISSIAGSSEDLIKDGINGYKFKSQNIDDLVSKIKLILGKDGRSKQMGANAYSLIKSFNFKNATLPYFDMVGSIGSTGENSKSEFNEVAFAKATSKKSLSIIIPVKDDPKGLIETLFSIKSAKQSRDVEIVVANDGGDPQVSEICKDFDAVEVKIKRSSGSYSARNKSLQVSTGDKLAFVDAGSIVSNSWIKFGIDSLISYDYVGGPINILNDPKKISNLPFAYETICEFPVKNFMDKFHFSPTTNLFVNRKVFNKLGGFDKRLTSSGDYEFGQRIYNNSISQYYNSQLIVWHKSRSYFSLLKKQIRLAKGFADLGVYYPKRFGKQYNSVTFFAKIVIPPIWLLSDKKFTKLDLASRIGVFFLAYQFSIIINTYSFFCSIFAFKQLYPVRV